MPSLSRGAHEETRSARFAPRRLSIQLHGETHTLASSHATADMWVNTLIVNALRYQATACGRTVTLSFWLQAC